MPTIAEVCMELSEQNQDQPMVSYLLKLAAVEAQDKIPNRCFRLRDAEVPLRQIGIWDWDVANDSYHGDPVLAEIFGTDPACIDDGVPNNKFVSSIHPDDKEEVMAAIESTLTTGAVFRQIYRVINKDRERTVLAKGLCTMNSLRRPERFAGTIIDITRVPTH